MASAKNAKSPSNSAGESTLDSSTTSSLATKEEEQRPKRKHPLQHFLAGGMAGFVESSCCHPLDTIKTRMQLRRQQAQSIGHSLRNINPLNRRGASSIGVAPLNRSSMSEPGTPTSAAKSSSTGLATSRGVGSSAGMASRVHGLGPIGTARRIIDREGFAALYKGLTAVYTGIIPKMAIRFVSFEYYRDVLLSREVMPPITSTFVAGLASGITEAIMVVTPAEVCKIRMQAQYHSMMDPVQMKHRKYTNVVQTAMTIVKEEGVGALYKGVVSFHLHNLGMPSSVFYCTMWKYCRLMVFPSSASPFCTKKLHSSSFSRCPR